MPEVTVGRVLSATVVPHKVAIMLNIQSYNQQQGQFSCMLIGGGEITWDGEAVKIEDITGKLMNSAFGAKVTIVSDRAVIQGELVSSRSATFVRYKSERDS